MSFAMEVEQDFEYKDEREELPDGVYRAIVDKVELKNSAKSIEKYMNVQFSVTVGDKKGRKFWFMAFSQHQNQNWANGTMKKLKSLVKETGAMRINANGDELVGREVFVEMKNGQIKKFTATGAEAALNDELPPF